MGKPGDFSGTPHRSGGNFRIPLAGLNPSLAHQHAAPHRLNDRRPVEQPITRGSRSNCQDAAIVIGQDGAAIGEQLYRYPAAISQSIGRGVARHAQRQAEEPPREIGMTGRRVMRPASVNHTRRQFESCRASMPRSP